MTRAKERVDRLGTTGDRRLDTQGTVLLRLRNGPRSLQPGGLDRVTSRGRRQWMPLNRGSRRPRHGSFELDLEDRRPTRRFSTGRAARRSATPSAVPSLLRGRLPAACRARHRGRSDLPAGPIQPLHRVDVELQGAGAEKDVLRNGCQVKRRTREMQSASGSSSAHAPGATRALLQRRPC